ncbi:hypothetical protein TKK_0001324 [Trichogramma kaykai]
MLHKLILIILFGLYQVSVINSKKLRIIEGEFALPGQFPHQVSIQDLSGDNCTRHVCGGSIIDEWHILTAAHCVTSNLFHEFNNKPITIVAGTIDLLNRTSAVYHDVELIFMPHSYTLNGYEEYKDDIAILKLRDPLSLDSHPYLRAVKLPASDQYLPPDNLNAVMSGFGVFKEFLKNGTWRLSYKSRYLRYAYGVINVPEPKGCLDSQICVKSLSAYIGRLEGVCNGDSGGPLYDEATNTLIGITSHKVYDRCGTVARFTRVSSFLDFINKVVFNRIDSTILFTKQSHNNAIEFPHRTVCNVR